MDFVEPFEQEQSPADRYSANELTSDINADGAASMSMNPDNSKLIIPTPLCISRTSNGQLSDQPVRLGSHWGIGYFGLLAQEAAYLAG
jgi:hypothetical protein